MLVSDVITIMKAAHDGQTDKSGNPYYMHPLWVMGHLGDVPDYVKVAALLHDTLEDTHLTEKDLAARGIEKRSIDIIVTVTRKKEETYRDFINRIATSGNEWAIRVKLADNAHNLSRPLPPEMEGLHRRYRLARAVLETALRNLAPVP